MRIIMIPANDTLAVHELEIDSLDYPGLLVPLRPQGTATFEPVRSEALHKLGGQFERWPSVAMIIDEEGKVHGLPVNRRASRLYGQIGDYIAGDAYLCSETDGYGSSRDFVGLDAAITVEYVTAVVDPARVGNQHASDEFTGLPQIDVLTPDDTIFALVTALGEGSVNASAEMIDKSGGALSSVDPIPVRYLHVRGLSGKDEWAQIHIAIPVSICMEVAAGLAHGAHDG